MGHEVVVAHPRGYELDGELMKTAKAQAAATGGKLEVTMMSMPPFTQRM